MLTASGVSFLGLALPELLSTDVRAETRERFGTSEVAGWDAALDDSLLELVRAGRIEAARAVLRGHLGLEAAAAGSPTPAEVSR